MNHNLMLSSSCIKEDISFSEMLAEKDLLVAQIKASNQELLSSKEMLIQEISMERVR